MAASQNNLSTSFGNQILTAIRGDRYLDVLNLTQRMSEAYSQANLATADDLLVFSYEFSGLDITENDLDKLDGLLNILEDYGEAGSSMIDKLKKQMLTAWALQKIDFDAPLKEPLELIDVITLPKKVKIFDRFKKIHEHFYDEDNAKNIEDLGLLIQHAYGVVTSPEELSRLYKYMNEKYSVFKQSEDVTEEAFLKFFLATYFVFRFKDIHEQYHAIGELTSANIRTLNKFNEFMAYLFMTSNLGSEFHLYQYMNEQYKLFLEKHKEQAVSDLEILDFLQKAFSSFLTKIGAAFESRQPKTVVLDKKALELGLLEYSYQFTLKDSEKAKPVVEQLNQETKDWKESDQITPDEKARRQEKTSTLNKAKEQSRSLISYLPKFIRLTLEKVSYDQILQFIAKLPEGSEKALLTNPNFSSYLSQLIKDLDNSNSLINSPAEEFDEEAFKTLTQKNSTQRDELRNKLGGGTYKVLTKELEYYHDEHKKNAPTLYIKNHLQGLVANIPADRITQYTTYLHEKTQVKKNPDKRTQVEKEQDEKTQAKKNAMLDAYLISVAKHIQDLNDPAADTFYRVHLARQHRNALEAFKKSGFPNAAEIAENLEAFYANKAKAASTFNAENMKKAWRFLWTDDPKEPVWRAMLLLPKKTNSTARNVVNGIMYGVFVVLGGFAIIPARIVVKTLFEGGALGLQKLIGTGITAIDKRFGVTPASTALMGLLTIPYVVAKGFRVVLRALTSPIRSGTEAFKTGSVVHRRLGIAMAIGSGILSAAWAVALSYVAAFGLAAGAAAAGSTPVLGPVITGLLKGISLFGAKLVGGTQALVTLAGGHPLATAFSVAGLSVEPALAVGTAVLAVSLPFMRKVADLAGDGITFAAKSLVRGLRALGQKLMGKKAVQPANNPNPAVVQPPAPAPVLIEAAIPTGGNTANIIVGTKSAPNGQQGNQERNSFEEGENIEGLGQPVPGLNPVREVAPTHEVIHSLNILGFSPIHQFTDPSKFIEQYKVIQAAVENVTEILGTTDDKVEIIPPAKDTQASFRIAKDVKIERLLEKLEEKEISYKIMPNEGKHILVFDDLQFQKALDAVQRSTLSLQKQ